MSKQNINCISLSAVKKPKCLVLRYYDKQTLKHRKRVIPIRYIIREDNVDSICNQLMDRHKPYLETVPQKQLTLLLKLFDTSGEKQPNVDKSVEEFSFNEDDEEFVF